ncbi:MAG: class I SAM-dependent rRNA methyltransferase [Elusimicrobiota bacterium]
MTGKIFLKKNEEERLNAGHLWIFSNEIQKIEGEPGIGDTAELFDSSKQFAGVGFYNPKSLIAFRLLSKKHVNIDKDFWKDRIERAVAYRKAVYPVIESYRVVFGESDALPGLIVDKYGNCLAVQFLSAGMEKNSGQIIEALKEIFKPAGIIAKNESSLRKLEGLEEKTEILYGSIPDTLEITESGLKFSVDLKGGQKTGFFFDQRDNRQVFSGYCKGKNVLDCFCHTGAFGICAAKAGAKSVMLVDSSKPAIEKTVENAGLNDVAGTIQAADADVEEYMQVQKRSGKKFDIINLDPPALIKSRKNFFAGVRLYAKLNALAMELLEPGGILATSSCSHHLNRDAFLEMLREAGGKAGRQFRIMELRSQAKDHPVLLSMPETEYLKFAILKVV